MKTLLSIVSVFFALNANAVQTGEMAPNFTLKGSDGKTYELSKLKDKYVVLEWLNHGCPFVKKHYGSGNMQALQKELTKKGVVWLSVISSAEGKQGYSTEDQANSDAKSKGAAASAILLDPKGRVGRLYGARTTPNMYVIDPKGLLVYQGAIDSIASADQDDIPQATNYVRQAVQRSMAGKAVEPNTTKPYGCSVKY